MLKARRKISQKELKKDKLVTSYFQSKDWISKEENKKRVYIGIGVVVVLALAVYFYMDNRKAKNEEAEAKLSAVISLYEQNKYTESINGDPAANISGLNEIVNNYGGTESGQTAKFYLANCYYNIHDYDNALRNFEDYSGKNDILKASCISGIGAVYEARGDLKKAAEYFEKSTKVNKDIIINQENLYYAIRAYSQAGDKEKAKKMFDALKKDYPKSKYINDSKKFESTFSSQ